MKSNYQDNNIITILILTEQSINSMPCTMLNDLHKLCHLIKAIALLLVNLYCWKANHCHKPLKKPVSFLLVYRPTRLTCSRLSSAAQPLLRLWPALPRVYPESSQLHVLDPFAATWDMVFLTVLVEVHESKGNHRTPGLESALMWVQTTLC